MPEPLISDYSKDRGRRPQVLAVSAMIAICALSNPTSARAAISHFVLPKSERFVEATKGLVAAEASPPLGLRGELSPDKFPTPPAARGSNVTRLQVGALPSAYLARKTFDELARSFPDDFAAKASEIEPVTLGKRTIYRVLVAGFTSERDARLLCRKLNSAGRPCLLRNRR